MLKERALNSVRSTKKRANSFYGILTDEHVSTEEVIVYYNQRGRNEKISNMKNNDFGWKYLPCSDMNHNT
ncbi:MAG: hypothetical protein LBF59_01360, partial [Prevotellaceae bacterium]|nr:hypothetical protein [Prevotellaceae bacterium]